MSQPTKHYATKDDLPLVLQAHHVAAIMMQEIKARIDDGLLELTGKVRLYPRSNVVEVEYRYCE